MIEVRSFFDHHGILSICIITISIFGQFGLRPSQTKYKCFVYFLDIWFLCSYTLFCLGTIWQLIITFTVFHGDTKQIPNLFNASFIITATFIFTVWLAVTFKKYNLFCLLEDIVDVRSCKLSKGHRIYIAATVLMVGSVMIIVNYAALRTFLSTYTNHPVLIVLMLIHSNIIWMLVWNITLLLCVNAFIISREFQKCLNDLEIDLNENVALFSDIFLRTIERFRELTSIVNKMDFVFSFPLGLILGLALSDMCGAIYSMVTGDTGGKWYIAVMGCAMTLGFPLLSLSNLTHQVCKILQTTMVDTKKSFYFVFLFSKNLISGS